MASIKKVFTSEETLKILQDLLINNKTTKEVYLLFGLWTTSVMNQAWTGMFRKIIGVGIDVFDFSNNTEYYKDIMQDAIAFFITTTTNEITGKQTGIKYKVHFDKIPIKDEKGNITYKDVKGNERQIIEYLKTCFKNCLYKAINNNIRQGIPISAVYALKKKPDMLNIKKVIDNEDDKSITHLDLITNLKAQGFTDEQLYMYRVAYYSGDLSNFTNLDQDVLDKNIWNTKNKMNQAQDIYRKELYEAIHDIIQSKTIPLVYREFLKAFYEIPFVVTVYNKKVIIIENLANFLSKFPEYMEIFKVKRVFYVAGKKCVKFENRGNREDLKHTKLYKESHKALMELVKPKIEHLLEEQELLLDFQEDVLDIQSADASDRLLTHTFHKDLSEMESILDEGVL